MSKTLFTFKCGCQCEVFVEMVDSCNKKSRHCPNCCNINNGPSSNRNYTLQKVDSFCNNCGAAISVKSKGLSDIQFLLCKSCKSKNLDRRYKKEFGYKQPLHGKIKAKCPKCSTLHLVKNGRYSTKLPRVFCSVCEHTAKNSTEIERAWSFPTLP